MIYLIITTCIQNKWGVRHAALRETEYKTAIQATLSLLPPSIKPIIVENNGLRPTFLDFFDVPVYYTNNNGETKTKRDFNEFYGARKTTNRHPLGLQRSHA